MATDNKSYFTTTPVARAVPYDPTASGLTSTDVQDAIDEIASSAAVSASPGFTWGRSGNVSSGSYLTNDSVPSNTSGRTVMLNSARITDISIANEGVNTFTIKIEEHDGTTFTNLGTFSVVSAITQNISVNISVTKGKMLAVSISAGSAKNPVISLILRGTI